MGLGLLCLVYGENTGVRRVLCMGLQCLVYGKNVGVLIFYVWVAWRRGWEGNGVEGCCVWVCSVWFMEKM
jgi:hypothetical protein